MPPRECKKGAGDQRSIPFFIFFNASPVSLVGLPTLPTSLRSRIDVPYCAQSGSVVADARRWRADLLDTLSFAELGLSAKVMEAIEASGYTTPTPIQAGAIPVAVAGRDVLGIAQTGTGKTASFVLPLLTRLEKGRARARMPRSLILAPTRELAAQVSEAFVAYGSNHKFTIALLIGGVSFGEQLKKLDRGVDVLIATPGRLLDHIGRGKLLLTGVEFLVIDEADRMLDMGFIPDIEKICKLLPPRRQTLFFSATMPSEITRLAKQFLRDPERIEVAPPATTAKTITQRFQFLPDGTDWVKRETLRDMIRSHDDLQNAIIFCNRKRDVSILLKSLKKHGFNAGALHGDMDQSNRMATLAAFRAGEITILAASDVAARGLDIPAVSHVFNYDMPWQSDDYVHRIGRTGRAGRQGYAAALVTADDLKVVRELEKLAGEEVEWLGDAPGEDAVAASARGGRGRGRGGRGADNPGRGGSRGGARSGGRSRGGASGNRSGGNPAGDRPGNQAGNQAENQAGNQAGDRPAAAKYSEGDAGATSGRGRSRRGRRGRGGSADNQSAETEQIESSAVEATGETQARTGAKSEVDTRRKNEGPEARAPRRSSRRSSRGRSDGDASVGIEAGDRSGQDQAAGSSDAQPAVSRDDRSAPARPDQPARSDQKGSAKRQPRNSRNNDETAPRGKQSKVEGDARGLGDNVPAFLQRPVRINSR